MRRVHVPKTARPSATAVDAVEKSFPPSAPGYGAVMFTANSPITVPATLPLPTHRHKAYDGIFAMPEGEPDDRSRKLPGRMGVPDIDVRTPADVLKGLPPEVTLPLTVLIKEQMTSNTPARARAEVAQALHAHGVSTPVQRVVQARLQRLLQSTPDNNAEAVRRRMIQERSVKPVVVVPATIDPVEKGFMFDASAANIPDNFVDVAYELLKAGRDGVAADLLVKGAGHKYLKRTGTTGSYRYHYAVTEASTNARDAKVGDKFKLADNASGKKGHYEVTHDHGDGNVTIRHDETGSTSKLSRTELHAHVASEHKATHTKAASKAMSGWDKANSKGDHKTAAKFADAAAKHFGKVEEADAGMGGAKLSDHWKGVAAKHTAAMSGTPDASPSPSAAPKPAADSPEAKLAVGAAKEAYLKHTQAQPASDDPKKHLDFHEKAAGLADEAAKLSGQAQWKNTAARHKEKAATAGAQVKDAPKPAEGYAPKAKAAQKASAEAANVPGHKAAIAAHEAARKEANKFGGVDAKLAEKGHEKAISGHKKAIAGAVQTSRDAMEATAKANKSGTATDHTGAAMAHAKAADVMGEGAIADLHKQHAANHVKQSQVSADDDKVQGNLKESQAAMELSKKAKQSGTAADHNAAGMAHFEASTDSKLPPEIAAKHTELSEMHKQEGAKASVPEAMEAAKAARKEASTKNTHEAHAAASKAINDLVRKMKTAKGPEMQEGAKPGEKPKGPPGAAGQPPAEDPNIKALQDVADQHYADAFYMKQNDPKTKFSDATGMNATHVKKPTVPPSLKAVHGVHTAAVKYDKPDGKLHLQGMGKMDAVKVGNLKPGTVTHWNQSYGENVVVDVKKSGKMHELTERNIKTGKTYTRKKSGDTLVGVHSGHFKPAAEAEKPKE